MKVALLQLNPVVGRMSQNADRLLEFAARARAGGADLAIASELTIPGYPPRDLLERPGFVNEIERETRRVVEHAPSDLVLLFGTVSRARAPGRSLMNSALAISNGSVLARADKRLLPTYDVFDEARHFEPGTGRTTFTVCGARVTPTICEDAWGDAAGIGSLYHVNPLEEIGPDNTDVFVNLSASPFTLHKLAFRPKLFADIAKKHRVSVVLVNQVGGNDELIFDGRSCVWDDAGNLVARAPMFEESLDFVDIGGTGPIAPEAESRAEAVYGALVLGVRDYVRKCGFSKVVVGLSGGIDSALTATIAVDALGANAVTGVSMPTRYSSEGSLADAAALAQTLGIAYDVIDIDPIFATYLERLRPHVDRLGAPGPSDVTWENIQARIRGATVMAISNRTGAMVLTTGNKSEVAVGYATLYGDMAGGLAAISDLPKMMVYEVARWVNRNGIRIPQSSIEKAPSAELRPDQKDEDSLPPYPVLDAILELHVEQAMGAEEIVSRGYDAATVARVLNMVRASEYKRRQAAPGLIVTSKAFGVGRRMPLAQGFIDR
jgi:NAD+ synthetase